MNVSEFDFDLPDELVAQAPPPRRGASRLLVLRRAGGLEHSTFAELPAHLTPGDVLVLNNTRVFPARLLGRRMPSGGAVECLLIRELPRASSQPSGQSEWEALMHPGQKLKPGARVVFTGDGVSLQGEVVERHFFGRRTVRLWTEDGSDVMTVVERIGHMPLPPYIARADHPSDRERYQTIYAKDRGSIAAPTAGLHFTPQLLEALTDRGIVQVEITLHVGYGTFKPVRVARVEEHEVDPETFNVGRHATDAINAARIEGRRVIAVGTTTTRALESLPIDDAGRVQPASGETRLFIRPGHRFRIVQGLVTNFHLPQSSLLMLVAAFGGRERVLDAYRAAVRERYRFYSYGDAMLLL